MNYTNMYEITKYCENNGIDLDKELVDILIGIDSLNEKLFPILKLESELAKNLLRYYASFEEELLSLFEIVNLGFEEIIYCLKLIAIQSTPEKMKQICIACLNDSIRVDLEALKLIASADTWQKMDVMRHACENDSIRQDKEALKLIAKQDTPEKMQGMRFACLVDEIREDKDALNLIANGDTWQCMRELRFACCNDAIRNDKEVLNLIASGDTWQKIEVMRLICANDTIRQDKELLHLIASMDTWQKMERIRQAFNRGQSLEQIKEMLKSERDTIAQERAKLKQEQQLLESLKTGKIAEFQDLFQENPDLNSETPIRR